MHVSWQLSTLISLLNRCVHQKPQIIFINVSKFTCKFFYSTKMNCNDIESIQILFVLRFNSISPIKESTLHHWHKTSLNSIFYVPSLWFIWKLQFKTVKNFVKINCKTNTCKDTTRRIIWSFRKAEQVQDFIVACEQFQDLLLVFFQSTQWFYWFRIPTKTTIN